MMKNITVWAFVMGMLAFGSSPFAAEPVDCNKVCQNAIAVLKTPTTANTFIRNTRDGEYVVYITWTSNTNPALAPVKYEGVVHAKLRSARLSSVELPNLANGCDAIIELIDRGAKGKKTYHVPVRNVLCETPSGAMAEQSK